MTDGGPAAGDAGRAGGVVVAGRLKKSISEAAGAPGGRNRSALATGLPSGVVPGCQSGAEAPAGGALQPLTGGDEAAGRPPCAPWAPAREPPGAASPPPAAHHGRVGSTAAGEPGGWPRSAGPAERRPWGVAPGAGGAAPSAWAAWRDRSRRGSPPAGLTGGSPGSPWWSPRTGVDAVDGASGRPAARRRPVFWVFWLFWVPAWPPVARPRPAGGVSAPAPNGPDDGPRTSAPAGPPTVGAAPQKPSAPAGGPAGGCGGAVPAGGASSVQAPPAPTRSAQGESGGSPWRAAPRGRRRGGSPDGPSEGGGGLIRPAARSPCAGVGRRSCRRGAW
jgi:hypothetical protein